MHFKIADFIFETITTQKRNPSYVYMILHFSYCFFVPTVHFLFCFTCVVLPFYLFAFTLLFCDSAYRADVLRVMPISVYLCLAPHLYCINRESVVIIFMDDKHIKIIFII